MEIEAQAKYIRISPKRLRLVVDLIRGKTIHDALSALNFSKKKAGGIVNKVLHSAISNAKMTGKIDIDTLFVKKAFVNEGPLIKRMMPRAMGRAARILKRTSHIKLVLEEK
jgi:large subunit ribosomal protein L22